MGYFDDDLGIGVERFALVGERTGRRNRAGILVVVRNKVLPKSAHGVAPR
jgi:hypothetical protein